MVFYKFQKAIPVWGSELKNEWNQFLGFRTEIDFGDGQDVTLAIAARSYYRLYINGVMHSHGPARTAHNYARVDLHKIPVKGKVSVAIEVAAYNKPNGYANDITMEPGMLTAEISVSGQVVSATGWNEGCPWKYTELTVRCSKADLISHSRGIIEVYDLFPEYCEWQIEDPSGMLDPVTLRSSIPTYLKRRAPHPTYTRKPVERLIRVGDSMPGQVIPAVSVSKVINSEWYSMLGESITDKVSAEQESHFTGQLKTEGGWIIEPGLSDAYLIWDLCESSVGFIEFEVEVTEDAIIDIIHDDTLDMDGSLTNADSLVRYKLKKGKYHLITFEPYLVRYLKLLLEHPE